MTYPIHTKFASPYSNIARASSSSSLRADQLLLGCVSVFLHGLFFYLFEVVISRVHLERTLNAFLTSPLLWTSFNESYPKIIALTVDTF